MDSTEPWIGCLSWYAGTCLRLSKEKKTQQNPKTQANKQQEQKPPYPWTVALTTFHDVKTATIANFKLPK